MVLRTYSDPNVASFVKQLGCLGLQLRDIAGDGNCLFRALGDQLEGHSRNHLQYRREIVKYMCQNREDFEPFIEDNCSFNDYVNKLQQDGTYAGNDALVAFARHYNVKVVIHQLCAPVWIIDGNPCCIAKELHIAYHNGDHYSSVRRMGDDSCTPARVFLSDLKGKKSKRNKNRPYPCTVDRQVRDVMEVTECNDCDMIEKLLEDNNYDVDQVVMSITDSNVSIAHSVKNARSVLSGMSIKNNTCPPPPRQLKTYCATKKKPPSSRSPRPVSDVVRRKKAIKSNHSVCADKGACPPDPEINRCAPAVKSISNVPIPRNKMSTCCVPTSANKPSTACNSCPSKEPSISFLPNPCVEVTTPCPSLPSKKNSIPNAAVLLGKNSNCSASIKRVMTQIGSDCSLDQLDPNQADGPTNSCACPTSGKQVQIGLPDVWVNVILCTLVVCMVYWLIMMM